MGLVEKKKKKKIELELFLFGLETIRLKNG